jgi:hypothetical protein
MKITLRTGAVIRGRQINIHRLNYIAIKNKLGIHYIPKDQIRSIGK